jgi:hypothetical protein
MSKLRLVQAISVLLMFVGIAFWVIPETSPYGLTLFLISILANVFVRILRFVYRD